MKLPALVSPVQQTHPLGSLQHARLNTPCCRCTQAAARLRQLLEKTLRQGQNVSGTRHLWCGSLIVAQHLRNFLGFAAEYASQGSCEQRSLAISVAAPPGVSVAMHQTEW